MLIIIIFRYILDEVIQKYLKDLNIFSSLSLDSIEFC